MNAFVLKFIAMTAMVVDHIGYCFANTLPGPVYLACRLVGRIAMPIFCFQIAEGLFFTRNVRKYLLRLAVFAAISEVPYDLMLSGKLFDPGSQNVGFTLLAGLSSILLYDIFAARGQKYPALIAILAPGLAAALFHSDYGLYGVYFVFIFYFFRSKPRHAAVAFAVGVAMQMLDNMIESGTLAIAINGILGNDANVSINLTTTMLLAFAFTAVLPIRLYNSQRGPGGLKIQLAFYSVYPLHMLILYVLSRVF